MKSDKDLWLAYLCFFGLPLLAVGLYGFFGYQVALIQGMSAFAVVPLSVVFGALILEGGIASCGTDMADFAVPSVLVIVGVLVCGPMLLHRAEIAHRRDVERALKRKTSPTLPKKKRKAPQQNR